MNRMPFDAVKTNLYHVKCQDNKLNVEKIIEKLHYVLMAQVRWACDQP